MSRLFHSFTLEAKSRKATQQDRGLGRDLNLGLSTMRSRLILLLWAHCPHVDFPTESLPFFPASRSGSPGSVHTLSLRVWVWSTREQSVGGTHLCFWNGLFCCSAPQPENRIFSSGACKSWVGLRRHSPSLPFLNSSL